MENFEPNSNITEAKFAIHNTTATLLQNDCRQINIKTKISIGFV